MDVVGAFAGQLGPLVAGAPADPSAVAVEAVGVSVTYGELAARAAGLARHLPGAAVVAVLAPRGPALVVGALASWRAGCPYLPLDPAYPDARLGWMLEDSGATVVVTTEELRHRVRDLPVAVLDGRGALVAAPGDVAAPAGAPPDGAAYVVYTSGSTGTPKGVVVGAGGLAQLVSWHQRAFGLGSADRTTLLASPGFDASVWEIWPTLTAGATLVVPPDEVRADPRRLRDWLVGAGITVSFAPTVVAEALVALPWVAGAPLRWLLAGGDALHAAPPGGLPFQLVNNYGVSEATVVSTSTVVPPGAGVPSIGSAIDGTVVEVVDADLQPVADGTAGELLISGAGVALGYLDRPQLTEERFVTRSDGSRAYRSGDLVRRRPDGLLDHLGRVDEQLSIRGFRVEPAEVVAALDRHPAVATSAVAAQGDGAARRLVAWAVPAGGGPLPVDEVRVHLERTVPAALVPSLIVPVTTLPTTAHGKVDRQRLLDGLADHEPLPPAVSAADDLGGASSEAAVAGIVAELLGLPGVGRDEDFFLLGGHSMLGAELLGRIDDLFGVELSLRTLFDGPTVAQIAAAVDAALPAPAATRA